MKVGGIQFEHIDTLVTTPGDGGPVDAPTEGRTYVIGMWEDKVVNVFVAQDNSVWLLQHPGGSRVGSPALRETIIAYVFGIRGKGA